jgi:hypothetical protein
MGIQSRNVLQSASAKAAMALHLSASPHRLHVNEFSRTCHTALTLATQLSDRLLPKVALAATRKSQKARGAGCGPYIFIVRKVNSGTG